MNERNRKKLKRKKRKKKINKGIENTKIVPTSLYYYTLANYDQQFHKNANV